MADATDGSGNEAEDEQNSSGDGDDNIDTSEGNENEVEQFDVSLAASHSYMGPDLVAISGRSILEAGWTGKVPVVAHHGVVFPGETVPMLLTNSHDAVLMSQILERDKLFGLLCPDETGAYVSFYGVLCEVYEAGETHGVRQTLTFKARANHRFRFKDMPRQSQPIQMYTRVKEVEIRVLPEVQLGNPLYHVRLPSLDHWRRDRTKLDNKLRYIDSMVTSWPLFVYDIFDYPRMKQTIKDYFYSGIVKTPIPDDAVSLSFWTASNLMLSARDRLALFIVDDALLRLYMEVRLISRDSVLCCASCFTEITRREHILAMSSEGVHANYTNLGGYMHDIVTVSRVYNTELSGPPSTEFSWFPGYSWSIAICSCCMVHVGWRFDAVRRNIRPQQFYGLCRNYVLPQSSGRRRERNTPPFRDEQRTPDPTQRQVDLLYNMMEDEDEP